MTCSGVTAAAAAADLAGIKRASRLAVHAALDASLPASTVTVINPQSYMLLLMTIDVGDATTITIIMIRFFGPIITIGSKTYIVIILGKVFWL